MLMKRNFALIAVMALLPVFSCQQEKGDIAKTTPNPSYDPETNTVKAQFVLSVSTEADESTKTTAEYVQYKKPFLGMENVHLLAYALDYTNENHGPFLYDPFDRTTATPSPIAASRDYNLGALFPKGAEQTRSVELALPLGANALLLYGTATKSSGSDDLQGSIIFDGNTKDITSLHFDLQPRLTSMDAFDVGAYFFSNMLRYFCVSGLVNEVTFWDHQVGEDDKSYKFWYPNPQVIKDGDNITYNAVDSLAKYYPAPADQAKVSDDGPAKTSYECDSPFRGVEYTYYTGEISWKQVGTMYDWEFDNDDNTKSDSVVKTKGGVKYQLSPLAESLGYAYSVLTHIKSKGSLEELRAGSALAVKRVMEDLYAVIERCAAAVPTGWEEHIAMLLAKEIQGRMENFFKMYSNGFDFLRAASGTGHDIEALTESISLHSAPDRWNAYSAIFGQLFDESYFDSGVNTGFPINVGLPAGAAILACERDVNMRKVDEFNYNKNIPAYGFGTDVAFPIENYRYPAELVYYGNSAIRTSSEVKKSLDYPNTILAWNSETWWNENGWNSLSSVESNTRSVAMINNINYGTALLESKVRFGAETLMDNRKACTGEDDVPISTTYDEAQKGIFVTGVIVGGQADVVGWNFTRRPLNAADPSITFNASTQTFENMEFNDGTKSNGFDKLVYDKVMGTYKVGVTAEPIYTMVWDNYDATKAIDMQDDVYVGLELLNNTDDDFWGEMNLIRKGGVFYLIGKLDLSTAIDKARENNPEAFKNLDRKYDCYPPYDNNGNTVSAPRVFMQDYITMANLILGADCLKHAYVTVPDLRSSQISLGLSVDMSWTTGLEFDVQMGTLD